jgi:hypothetical protein
MSVVQHTQIVTQTPDDHCNKTGFLVAKLETLHLLIEPEKYNPGVSGLTFEQWYCVCG